MYHQLCTKWGENLDKEHVLTEYPRPSMVRDSYQNLNGEWEYAISRDEALPEVYDGAILVPFSPEAALSGVERTVYPKDVLHYKRIFETEKPKGKRILLHFGAVDQSCKVYINQRPAGSHEGGYLPFTLDITDLAKAGENTVQVVVRDCTDTSYHARGKQKIDRGGMFYQAQSGIWQTVWLETVPEQYIYRIKITPCFDIGEVRIKAFSCPGIQGKLPAADSSGNAKEDMDVEIQILDSGAVVAEAEGKADTSIQIAVLHFEAWTPENPKLYDVKIRMGEDEVRSYFAMRKCSVGKDRNGILRFMLNNQPYFHNGVLDQGYWPEGLYTAPCDEAMVYDIAVMKKLGFNMIRKHSKIEPERWYYHCDRLGMLVWQDMVNGGTAYHMRFVCVLPNFWMKSGRLIKDDKYKAFSRQDIEGRREYYRELKAMAAHLFNHPSIAAWVPFNEGWGQFDAARASRLMKKLDPGRLVDEASGWFDQGGGDMYSIHNYWRKFRCRPQKDRVVALTEYGGYSWQIKGHSYCDKVYGYRKYDSMESLTKGYKELWEQEIIPAVKRGLGGTVYTQLSDIEDEVNGILTYDRKIEKIQTDVVQRLNKKLYEEFKRHT